MTVQFPSPLLGKTRVSRRKMSPSSHVLSDQEPRISNGGHAIKVLRSFVLTRLGAGMVIVQDTIGMIDSQKGCTIDYLYDIKSKTKLSSECLKSAKVNNYVSSKHISAC